MRALKIECKSILTPDPIFDPIFGGIKRVGNEGKRIPEWGGALG